MKRSNYIFAVFAIVAAIIFVLTGAFFCGSVSTPSTFWLTTVKVSDGDVGEASATFLLDRTRESQDGEISNDVSAAYIFIGEIYTCQESGEVTVYFDFKTEYSADDRYVDRETVVLNANSRYGWIEAFSGKEISSCSKVKVHTPYEIEIGEIVFAFKDGEKIPVKSVESQTAYGQNPFKDAEYAVDEKNSFYLSDRVKDTLTPYEIGEMSAAYGLFTGGKTVGSSPLTTLFNSISILIFGRNTFAVRFFSIIFGYACVIMIYLMFFRLFGKDEISILASVAVLAMGATFGSITVASASVPTFFILWAYYLAFGFYAKEVKFEDKRSTVFNLLLTGIAIGLSLSCGVKRIVSLAGIPVIWGLSLKNLSADFKKEYEASSGIKKDNIFVAYHKKKSAYAKLMPLCFAIIPVFLLAVFYAVSAKPLTAEYGFGFWRSMLVDVGNSFKVDFSLSLFVEFIGVGGAANAIPKYIALFSVLFVTIGFFFGDNKLKPAARSVGRKFVLVSVAFLSLLISYSLGYGDGFNAFGAISVFYSGYIPLLICVVGELRGEKAYRGLIIGAIILLAASFVASDAVLKLIFNI
ncbi:MAG: phospholipid carrier-dependent glycosyltransferase [Clostridia bacterium]|nr:phospholipid carrier-dependent glycosyltransferase [Clostridia bacterium]